MQLHGLRLDGVFSDSAQQTWAHAKNILLSRGFDEVENEPGDTLIDSSITGSIIGRIITPNDIILFTYNGTNIYIRHLSSTGTLTTILTSTTTFLNFAATGIYVEGVHCYNNEGDLIIAWTFGMFKPMIMNVTHHLPGGLLGAVTIDAELELKDYYLFPEFNHNNFTLSSTAIITGGRLPAAAYFVSLTYELEPDVNTNFGVISNPIFITEEDSLTEYKQFKGNGSLVITNKGFIVNVTNIDTIHDYFKLVIIQKTETGTNCFITKRIKITIEAKLTNGLTKVIIDDLSKLIPFNLTEVVTSSPAFDTVKSITQSNKKLRLFGLTKPTKLPLATIYNDVLSAFTVNWVSDTVVALNNTKNSYKDSTFIFNKRGFRSDEVYALYVGLRLKTGGYYGIYHLPGRVEIFDEHSLVSVTGLVPDYKTFQVINTSTLDGNYYGKMGFWENENEVYPASYGTIAGSKVRHHRFPSAGKMHDWKSGVLHNVDQNLTQDVLGLRISLDWTHVKSVHANTAAILEDIIDGWEIFYAKRTLINQLMIDQSIVMTDGTGYRFYGFDSMVNLLNIEPTHVKAELKLDYSLGDYIVGSGINEIVNYTRQTTAYASVTKIKYLPAYNSTTIPDNTGKENCYYFETNVGTFNLRLVNFINIKDDVYLDFTSQELVSTGVVKPLVNTTAFSLYGGDTFIGHNSIIRFPNGSINDRDIWYFPVESILNSGMRYEGNNDYEKFFPLTDIFSDSNRYLTSMIAAGVANLYFYNNDYHLLNTFRQDNIDNELTTLIHTYPNRIQSSMPQPLESTSIYWRKFKILDYFDMVNNKGPIFKAIGNEYIVYIQTEFSIFRGIIVDKLITGNIDVALKSSEMFDRPLEELLDADGTYIKPWDREGTILTPYGLVTVDLDKGSIYVISDKATEITKLGIEDWFRKTVKTTMTFDTKETIGTGVILGYDDIYKRLFVTIKNNNPNIIANFTLSFQFEKMLWICFERYTPDKYIWNANGTYRIDGISISKMFNGGYGYTLNIALVMRSGTNGITVTVTTSNTHNLKTGDTIVVTGANVSVCNGTFLIVVTGLTTFIFTTTATVIGSVSGASIIASDPSYIDFIFNNNKGERFLLKHVRWVTNIENAGINIWNETIDKLLVYSKNLCSGEISIVKEHHDYNAISNGLEQLGNTLYYDGEWVYNDVVDYLTIPNSVFLDANGKIITSALNLSKNYFEKSYFIGKFIIVRLIYNNSSVTKKLRISNVTIETKNIL